MTGRIGWAAGALALLAATGAGAGDDPLAAYRWKARVLVIAAPDAGDHRLAAQRQALASEPRGLSARDLTVIEVLGEVSGKVSGDEARAWRDRLDLPRDAFRAVLVGKDGGAKLSSDEPIPPQTLFATIDAMPMRRDEMRRR